MIQQKASLSLALNPFYSLTWHTFTFEELKSLANLVRLAASSCIVFNKICNRLANAYCSIDWQIFFECISYKCHQNSMNMPRQWPFPSLMRHQQQLFREVPAECSGQILNVFDWLAFRLCRSISRCLTTLFCKGFDVSYCHSRLHSLAVLAFSMSKASLIDKSSRSGNSISLLSRPYWLSDQWLPFWSSCQMWRH